MVKNRLGSCDDDIYGTEGKAKFDRAEYYEEALKREREYELRKLQDLADADFAKARQDLADGMSGLFCHGVGFVLSLVAFAVFYNAKTIEGALFLIAGILWWGVFIVKK